MHELVGGDKCTSYCSVAVVVCKELKRRPEDFAENVKLLNHINEFMNTSTRIANDMQMTCK